jgi:hypothetical protein
MFYHNRANIRHEKQNQKVFANKEIKQNSGQSILKQIKALQKGGRNSHSLTVIIYERSINIRVKSLITTNDILGS